MYSQKLTQVVAANRPQDVQVPLADISAMAKSLGLEQLPEGLKFGIGSVGEDGGLTFIDWANPPQKLKKYRSNGGEVRFETPEEEHFVCSTIWGRVEWEPDVNGRLLTFRPALTRQFKRGRGKGRGLFASLGDEVINYLGLRPLVVELPEETVCLPPVHLWGEYVGEDGYSPAYTKHETLFRSEAIERLRGLLVDIAPKLGLNVQIE